VGLQCKVPWRHLKAFLRPTQNAVGWALVGAMRDALFSTPTAAQSTMNGKVVPVLKGFGSRLYTIDAHHHLSALDCSGHDDTAVTISVCCDLSAAESEAAFWEQMRARGLAYLFSRPSRQRTRLPVALQPSALPRAINLRGNASMRDDPWRSLAGFSLRTSRDAVSCPKDNQLCMAAFESHCSASGSKVPFYEFRWAHFFNAAYLNRSWFPSPEAGAIFAGAFEPLLSEPPSTHPNATAWQAAADALFLLARSTSASAFVAPATMQAFAGHLPGVVSGATKMVPAEAECSSCASCADAQQLIFDEL